MQVGIRYGHFYAYTLVDRLEPKVDVGDGVVRISLVHYNTVEEVRKIIEILDDALACPSLDNDLVKNTAIPIEMCPGMHAFGQGQASAGRLSAECERDAPDASSTLGCSGGL